MLKPFDVEVFLKNLRAEGRSISCITQCRGMLFQIMHKAEANDLILKNPVRFADKMKYREPKKRKEAFSAAEVSIMMEKLPKDKIGLLYFGISYVRFTCERLKEVAASGYRAE